MSTLCLPYMQPMGEKSSFQFFAMPKQLLANKVFEGLHRLAKLLYALMLDRLSLSAKNSNFTDDQGRIYIIYTVEQVQRDLQCSKGTAIKLLGQLAEWGLIEKKRCGQGRPNLLYIKDFRAVEEQPGSEDAQGAKTEPEEELDFKQSNNLTSEDAEKMASSEEGPQGSEIRSFHDEAGKHERIKKTTGLWTRLRAWCQRKARSKTIENRTKKGLVVYFKKSKIFTSRSQKFLLQEVKIFNIKKYRK